MSSSVLESAKRALVALDTKALASLYGEDIAFEDTSVGLRINTKEALIDYFNQLFAWPDVKFSNVSFFTAGDRGAGQWTWEGRSRQSGTPFAIRGASIFRLKAGTIAEEIIFYDPRPAYAYAEFGLTTRWSRPGQLRRMLMLEYPKLAGRLISRPLGIGVILP